MRANPGTETSRRTRGETRTKMLVAAVEVLRERGAAGVTIDEVLARSGAPRGSVYTTFRRAHQILREALNFAGDEITASIDEAAGQSATVLLRRFVQLWEDALTESDYTAGCPVLAAAVGAGEDEQQLTAVAADIFSRWREASKQAYVRDGFEPAEAILAGRHDDLGDGGRGGAVPVGTEPPTALRRREPTRIPHQGKGIRDEVRSADVQRLTVQRAQTKSPFTPVSASVHSERNGSTGAPEPRLHGA